MPSTSSARSLPPVYVFGAGGHGRVVADVAIVQGYEVIGFLDDHASGDSVNDIPLLGGMDRVDHLDPRAVFALGIGSNRARRAVAMALEAKDREIIRVIHPSAVISARSDIGAGVYVGPLAVVHVNAFVGRWAIVNTGALIDHQCSMGALSHVSANVILAGGSSVGEGALVGVGASILPGITIGAWTEVGAGAVVTRDLEAFVVAYGVPARVRRRVEL